MFTLDDLIAYTEQAEKELQMATAKVTVADELIALAKLREQECQVCGETECGEVANYQAENNCY